MLAGRGSSVLALPGKGLSVGHVHGRTVYNAITIRYVLQANTYYVYERYFLKVMFTFPK